MSEDEELDDLRKRRMLELQKRLAEEQQRAQIAQQLELQKQALLRQILTPEARQRMNNLKMVKPEFAAQLELQLIQLAQAGRLNIPLTDEQLKELLLRLQSTKRDIKIRRK
ncbi:MAG: DNA-binding protein [Candidatus Bathyarchaeia archaeon]|jgi:programmed cell death protein 5|nr:DNA-binding protein [Candidatus Bathyarchaeota archaeon A05DMB-4]MDH7595354.1 DNA-binding protein [Candidatus Bathyarchaeota archaeon]